MQIASNADFKLAMPNNSCFSTSFQFFFLFFLLLCHLGSAAQNLGTKCTKEKGNAANYDLRNPYQLIDGGVGDEDACKRSRSDVENGRQPLPIDTSFKLPSPLPVWPTDGGFAQGTIDLGGLEVSQISTFNKVWEAQEGGPDNLGATFFEPSPIPKGFFMLGSYSQPNKDRLSGWVLAGKDTSKDPSNGTLKTPVDYTLVWSSQSLNIKKDGNGYIWSPTPPEGYRALGYVVTSSPEKPSLEKIRCVRSDLTDQCENHVWIWGPGKDAKASNFNIHISRPSNRGIEARGVPVGTFGISGAAASSQSIACLKNNNSFLASMPNVSQIEALVKAYSPWIYFHSDEKYLPSSLSWFFRNGALLYKRGNESNPIPIDPTGSNLPQGNSSPDEEYWLDLPKDKAAKEEVQRGNLSSAGVYLHVKPMFGATFTDIAIWVFYPFNGPAKAKIEFFNLHLGKAGEHVGDWEHVTLRISNFNGELKSVYFAEHSGGTWVDASDLEFQNGNRFVAYSSLNGHALYPKPGLVLQGNGDVGIRNDCAKSKIVMDCGERFVIIAAEYLGSEIIELPWVNYYGRWGPKIEYNIADELGKVAKILPGKLKKEFKKMVAALPEEVLGEEGPTGPKVKASWNGDEED